MQTTSVISSVCPSVFNSYTVCRIFMKICIEKFLKCLFSHTSHKSINEFFTRLFHTSWSLHAMFDTGDHHIMSVINVSFVNLVVSEGHTLLLGENNFFPVLSKLFLFIWIKFITRDVDWVIFGFSKFDAVWTILNSTKELFWNFPHLFSCLFQIRYKNSEYRAIKYLWI